MRASFAWVAAALLVGAVAVGCGSSGGGGGGEGGDGGDDWQNTGGTGGTGTSGGTCTASSRPGTVRWSCDLHASSMCMDYIGSSFAGGADFNKVCTDMGGTYSSSPCDRSVYSGGGCLTECGSPDETMHFWVPGDMMDDIAEEACAGLDGTWID